MTEKRRGRGEKKMFTAWLEPETFRKLDDLRRWEKDGLPDRTGMLCRLINRAHEEIEKLERAG